MTHVVESQVLMLLHNMQPCTFEKVRPPDASDLQALLLSSIHAHAPLQLGKQNIEQINTQASVFKAQPGPCGKLPSASIQLVLGP